jgi:hypothetical protein
MAQRNLARAARGASNRPDSCRLSDLVDPLHEPRLFGRLTGVLLAATEVTLLHDTPMGCQPPDAD